MTREQRDSTPVPASRRRLEAISLSAPNQSVAGGIAYEVHAQGIGWMGEVADGTLAGTTGQFPDGFDGSAACIVG